MTNNQWLREAGLAFRNGRLKIEDTGEDLVLPEEMVLLTKLAGIGELGSA